MILKYIVPNQYKRMFGYKDKIYCKVIKTISIKTERKKVYLVRLLEENKTWVFSSDELKKLNIIEKLKLRRNQCI